MPFRLYGVIGLEVCLQTIDGRLMAVLTRNAGPGDSIEDVKWLNGKLKDLRKGDCIVSFSVMGIHALRQQIERQTGKKVATVYGSLPPETRAQQARLFNDPDNDYDFLVASDAVGMGLNLAIKRIVFEASNKFDGAQRRTLNVACWG